MAERTIESLNFEISYFEEDNFITRELYKSSPFRVEMDTTVAQPRNIKFNLFILSNAKFRLAVQAEKAILYDYPTRKETGSVDEPIIIDKEYNFGEEIETDIFKFTVYLTENYKAEYLDKNFSFTFNDYGGLISTFRSTQLEPINRESSIIQISIKGDNQEKLADYINELAKQYLLRGIEKKNQIAENTIRFIDSELIDITDSLTFTENKLQNFRVNNEVMSLDYKATQVFEGGHRRHGRRGYGRLHGRRRQRRADAGRGLGHGRRRGRRRCCGPGCRSG